MSNAEKMESAWMGGIMWLLMCRVTIFRIEG